MFVIEALDSDGWRQQGTASEEYWALQEAQILCCANGRQHRILHAQTGQLVGLVDPSSCRITPGSGSGR